MDENGNILKNEIYSKTIDVTNFKEDLSGTTYTKRDFNSLSSQQKDAVNSVSSFKKNNGHSPLKDTAFYRNALFGFGLSGIATVATAGQSTYYQAAAFVGSNAGSALLTPYNQSKIKKRVY